MSNDTTISCVGYANIPKSVGIVFSLQSGDVGNRYWTVAAPIVSGLSDWPRGSLSLFVNGKVRNTTTSLGAARGIAQHGSSVGFEQGTHNATVRYSRAMRMLYVTLDGASQPNLWAELDPDDLGMGTRPRLSAGFTATAPASGELISVDIRNWELRTTSTHLALSRLLEEGQIVGVVGEAVAVHIDARDSCELPRGTGGHKWAAAITGPTGKAVRVDGVDDLSDGTYRVRFTAPVAGVHRLTARMQMAGTVKGDSSAQMRATFEVAPST